MRSESETTAEIRTGPAYWLPWALVVLSMLLLRARIGVPGAPALLPNGEVISLAVDGRGNVWVAAMQDPGLVPLIGAESTQPPNPGIWRIDRWNRLRREVGSRFGGGPLDGSPVHSARLRQPYLVGFDGRDCLYFTDGGDLYRVEEGVVRLVARERPDAWWAAVGPDGSAYLVVTAKKAQVLRQRPDVREDVVAGTGERGFSGDGGQGAAARLNWPTDIAIAPDGCVYIAEAREPRVRRVGRHGIITTVAGTGRPGYGGDGGPAVAAPLGFVLGVGADSLGRVWIVDCEHDRLRRIEPDGTIVTAAGCGRSGCSGNGGPAPKAMVMCCWQLCAVEGGEVYFIGHGYGGPCVRKVDARGMISAVAAAAWAR